LNSVEIFLTKILAFFQGLIYNEIKSQFWEIEVTEEKKKEHEEIFKRFLSARGLNMTRERRKILLEVLKKKDHFQAEELAFSMWKAKNAVSRATVYRTLELLTEAGILRKMSFGEGGAKFELDYGKGYHGHLICLSCGGISEFPISKLLEIEEEAVKKQGFLIKKRSLLIFGYCRSCRKKKERE
jgi:Fur family ferric uptake transcriptional regulator